MEKLSHKDPNQVTVAEHSDMHNAKRCVIVGGELPDFTNNFLLNTSSIEKLLEEQIKLTKENSKEPISQVSYERFEVPVIIKEPHIVEVERVVIQKEVQILEIPKFIETIKYMEVQIPVITKEIQEIEKIKELFIPNWLKIVIIVQSIVSLVQLFKR